MNRQRLSRRRLLKCSAATLVASSLLLTGAEAATTKGRKAMLIDVNRCYGCMACVVACAAENNVPLNTFRTWVERHVTDAGVVMFVPKQCNHCENPPCVAACPVNGATYNTEDGLVLVNDNLCIGCGACIQACPYGARFRNSIKGVADKCTFCSHRLAKALLPACVETCPTGARIFGSIDEGELKQIVESRPTQILKRYTGTDPHIYYVALPREADM